MLILLFATLLVKNLGQFVGWGWQLQSSLMSSVLALLFFVLGIIFISRIEFGNFMTRLGNINVNKSGYSNSFLLGFLTVIVATPCTGPYMGAAIGWGISQPITISALIFLSLGFGIAFPTFLLSILPKGINFLPKPGPWMENVARFMGVPMFLTSLWLSWVVYRQTGLEGIIVLSFAALAILIAFIMLKASSSKASRIGLPLIALSFLITIIFVPNQTTNNNQDINFGKRWSAEKVKQLREEEKRILLNFTADWCLTCKVNERLVFNSEDFVKLVETGEIEYLIADWTKYDPNITAELEKYKRAGVPLYLYWGEGLDEVKILPSVLTKSILYDHLKL
jgi:thiol:disulfide interchange protein DsbD